MATQPQLSSTYVAKSIEDAAISYKNALYIAPLIFPEVVVPQRQGKYFVFDDGESFIDAASPNRQPGTDAPRGGYTVTTESFDCKELAFAHEIPDEVVTEADAAIMPFRRGIGFCMEKVLLRRERLTAAAAFVASTWGTGTDWTGTGWDDFVDGDPANDIQTGKSTIKRLASVDANTLVLGQQVFDKLILNPDALDRIKRVQNATLEAVSQSLAGWLGVARVIVGGASYNAAAEGATTDKQFIWAKNALLLYVPDAPAKDVPAAGYLFRTKGVETRQWREDSPRQTVVEASVCVDPKRTCTKAGYYFPSVVS